MVIANRLSIFNIKHVFEHNKNFFKQILVYLRSYQNLKEIPCKTLPNKIKIE